MSTRHTPGPWYNTGCHVQSAVLDEDNYVANVEGRTLEEGCANAALIAAAPELLEALESFLRCPSVGSDGPGTVTIRVMDFNLKSALAAVEKAKEN